MAAIRFNLLTESLLQVRLGDGNLKLTSLPGLLAQLSAGEDIIEFPRVRLHQQHAFHAFLVQLAAIALHYVSINEPPHSSATWLELLRGLTGNRDEPFYLFVEDFKKPAFLQPPIREREGDYKNKIKTPDALDVLITAKNHDLKSSRAMQALPEYWIHSLIALQTMEGFSGRDNYGIARMNGGLGSRPCVTRLPGFSSGARFRRDLVVLQTERENIIESYGYAGDKGIALLWLEPWNGTTSLDLALCDPYFIEICRRVRLVEEKGRLQGRMAASKVPRIAAAERKGDVGDPWTPVKRDGTSLTVSRSGFDYKRTKDLLLEGEDYHPSPTQASAGEDEPYFYACVLVRGQGKTEGFHERLLPLPKNVRLLLRRETQDERERLAKLARQRVDDVALLKNKILKPALQALIQAGPDHHLPGPDKIDFTDNRPMRWLQELEQEIDRIFFDRLFRDMDLSTETRDTCWHQELRQMATTILARAEQQVPLPSVRRYRALTVASRILHGALRKHFPELTSEEERGVFHATS